MKMINCGRITKGFTGRIAFLGALFLYFSFAGVASAQTEAANSSSKTKRPEYDDPTSRKLIKNYLAATGGKQAHIDLQAVLATGTITEAGKIKTFRLIERQDGRRHLTYTWRHLGRDYEDVIAYDGVIAWKRRLSPQRGQPQKLSKIEAWHFANQRWLIQPFVVPLKAKYVFVYQGSDKVGGRDAHLIAGLTQDDERSFFYIDKETFLVTRWGGYGFIGGIKEYLDYQATRFDYVGGVLLAKELVLLAENQAFGKIVIDSIEANPTLDLNMFYLPPNDLPTLRQRPVQP
ncbi:MAG: hypothetical protein AAF546_01665 [Verrucomicrobiota bacterium]